MRNKKFKFYKNVFPYFSRFIEKLSDLTILEDYVICVLSLIYTKNLL